MGDRVGMVRTLYALGEVKYAVGENERARQYFQDSLKIYREMEDKSGIAKTLNSLGNIAYDMGDSVIAKRLYQQSLTLSREIGDAWMIAGSISTSEMEAIRSNQPDIRQTQEELLVALDAHARQGNKPRVAELNYELGEIALEAKQYPDARERYQQALDMYTEFDDAVGSIRALNRLAEISLSLADAGPASTFLRKALQLAVDNKETMRALKSLTLLARLYIHQDNKDRAMELLAFVMTYPEIIHELEDEAERMVFDLESELDQGVIERAWERGKSDTLDKLSSEILA